MTAWTPLFVTAQDGLRLHARDYGPRTSSSWPVVCLPGLARTAADFHEIAATLSTRERRPRRVIVADYRGRGLSERDPDPRNYDIRVENGDLQALLSATGIGHAAFVGTSRGGIHVMALAAFRPTAIAAAVLNDIGPVIANEGLIRIKGYVGRAEPPESFETAAASLEAMAGTGFSAFGKHDWLRLARRTFVETPDGLASDYDPALARALDAVGPDRPPPELWRLFDGLVDVPILAVRGANSDILSQDTLDAMTARRPDMQTLVVEGQAHAPPLWEEDVVARIAAFIDGEEDRRSVL